MIFPWPVCTVVGKATHSKLTVNEFMSVMDINLCSLVLLHGAVFSAAVAGTAFVGTWLVRAGRPYILPVRYFGSRHIPRKTEQLDGPRNKRMISALYTSMHAGKTSFTDKKIYFYKITNAEAWWRSRHEIINQFPRLAASNKFGRSSDCSTNLLQNNVCSITLRMRNESLTHTKYMQLCTTFQHLEFHLKLITEDGILCNSSSNVGHYVHRI